LKVNSASHSYWIPTNRPAALPVHSYLKEIDYWFRLTGDAIPLFLLDSGDADVEEQNALQVALAREKYPQLAIHHVSLARQQATATELLRHADCSPGLLESIAPRGSNYGAMMNKISLFAAMMESTVIHRRDSDTQLQENCPYPLEFEMQSLTSGKAQRSYIAGSGYVGEWNLDLKPFLQVSPDLFSQFWSAMGVDPALHQAIYEWVDGNSRAFYQADRVDYGNEQGFFMPDAGNMAIYRLHLLFPSLPSNAMSSDYSLFKMAGAFNLPVAYHQRRVVHEYHSGRKLNPMPYIMSLVKYCDLRPLYKALQHDMKQLVEQGTLTLDGNCQETAAAMLTTLAGANLPQRRQALGDFVNGFIARLYPDEANELAGSIDDVLAACRQDYLNHATLIRAWPRLVQAASRHGPMLRSLLTDGSAA
jgi:hypothetical protein